MPFSAQICITNTGTTQLGPTLYFYSDINGYQGSFGSDSTENLVGDNCPYTMENIPDGTTVVRIIDLLTNCGLDINLQSNDLCNTCNLNFDVYETQTVSQIVVGNLTGSCDNNITDYIINWYGPGEGSTDLVFTSGYGTEFADIGWDNTHPLTGPQSPIVESGIYTPVIDRIMINGTAYSLTGAPGTYIANLNCFTSALVTADAIKCDNGNLPPGGIYSHFFQFNNVSVGNPPIGLSASFELSSTTNYIAWQFKGYQVHDTLKMTFYGSAYNYSPLVIENVKIGLDAGVINVISQTNPKVIPYNSFVRKVTCLTAFTINEGDYITINITPNNTNNNTIWDFYLKCLDSFDCSTCFDQFENSFAKIYSASTTSTILPCNRVDVSLSLNLCTQQDFSETDISKYWQTPSTVNNFLNTSVVFDTGPEPMRFINYSCSLPQYSAYNAICSTPTNTTYSFQKIISESGEGSISLVFDSINDLNHYYNSYLSIMSTINTINGGASNDNTQVGYYRTFDFLVPYNTDSNQQCGDTTPIQGYNIHHTSVVTTGGTGPYTMNLTMPTIINNIDFDSCDLGCDEDVDYLVNLVNSSSLSQNNNIEFITNTGSKYVNPFNRIRVLSYSNNPATASTFYGLVKTYWTFENETYVYSGNNVLVSSLTGKTCESKGTPLNVGTPGAGVRFGVFSHDYQIRLTDQNNLNSFQIYAKDVSNYLVPLSSIYPNLAMTVVNNVVTYANPDYCI
jgi:hypothetical protein